MPKIKNSIGWCDDTGNKVIGCAKVSEGCKNCYAEVGTVARVMRHRAVNPVETWGAAGTRIAVADFTAKLKRLNRLCICDRCHVTQPFARVGQECGLCPPGSILADDECLGTLRRIRLFADSNSDWLDEAWDIETFAEFLREIYGARNLDILLLTKRIENFHARMHDVWDGRAITDRAKGIALAWSNGYPAGTNDDGSPMFDVPRHIWLGVSVENQRRADERIVDLLATPAAARFISFEPLLEDMDMSAAFGHNSGCDGASAQMDCQVCGHLARPVDWVIVGGESGPNRRDCGVEAIVSVAEQCVAADVPVYVKQDCASKSGQQGRIPDEIWKLKQFPVLRTATMAAPRMPTQSRRRWRREHLRCGH